MFNSFKAYFYDKFKTPIALNNIECDFSIVIPTRERYSLLIKCLDSIKNKTNELHKIEVILITDNDDIYSKEVIKDYKRCNPNVNIINLEVERSPYLNKDYYNFGFSQAKGKYFWVLGNDCEILTQNWDGIVRTQLESFLSDKKDRLGYVFIGDDLHNDRKEWVSCCFPILTREVLSATNCVMPQEILSYGGDHWLWQNFKKSGYPRILDIRDEVKILHYAPYTNRIECDSLTKRLYVKCKDFLLEGEEMYYINLIRLWIKKHEI